MFGYDPEAIYQDADIEMLELEEAAGFDSNAWKCEYTTCDRQAETKGVCQPHRSQELREMEDARR